MKIVVITPSKNRENEIQQVTAMFEAGLDTLHIRKPNYSTRQLKDYIESIPRQFHNRIIIHSHHNLARKYKLMGVHYTKKHFERSIHNWWRRIMIKLSKNDYVKTCSHRKLVSLYEEDDLIQYDYVFLSPIFDSITGRYQSGFYEESIKAAIQKTGRKIIARGGIDINKVEKVDELGFYGMALYSCIWEKENPLEEYLRIINRCDNLGIKVA